MAFDVDVLDPAEPVTSPHAVPHGLSLDDAETMLRAVADRRARRRCRASPGSVRTNATSTRCNAPRGGPRARGVVTAGFGEEHRLPTMPGSWRAGSTSRSSSGGEPAGERPASGGAGPGGGASGKRDPNTCPRCDSHYRDDELERTLRVCPHCGHHFPVRARDRVAQLCDGGTFVEADAELRSDDPLAFFDLRPYKDRLAEAEMATGAGDAILTGSAKIERRDCELAVMDFAFMGGSMGSAVGEKLARACERAAERRVPLVCVTASGGARMQEGILSLMQMPKTVCAVDHLRDARSALIVVMAHPTTGGVVA